MKYRSRTDIAAAILLITKEGALKSKIMYGCYLSFQQLREYLDILTDLGLLRYAGEEKKTYHTTELGLKFLNMYNEIDAMIPKANALTTVKK